MTIVFAENFEYESLSSSIPAATINDRYEGSYANGATNYPNAVYITSAYRYFNTDKQFFDPNVNTRFEILMGTDYPSTTTTAATLNIFGIRVTYTGGRLTTQGADLPDLRNAKTIHFIVEKAGDEYELVVLADGEVVLTPTIMPNGWKYNSWIGTDAGQPGINIANFPRMLTYLVLAIDTPKGTRIANPTFTKHELTVEDAGNWQHTDKGIVEDTDKKYPTIATPNIYSEDGSELSLKINDVAEGDLVNLYLNVVTDKPEESLEVNGKVLPAGKELRTIGIQHTGPEVKIKTVVEKGLSNYKGLRFMGERSDLISYADLSTQLNFTAGTLNTGTTTVDRWLHINLEGQIMYVARGPVRWNVSWDQIYAAGLVYGVDGFGFAPTGTPVNQMRTIQLEGKTYVVRLLKGLDTNPGDTPNSTSGNDVAGTQNSEWSRIFYPLCVDDSRITSYTGPKIANYTMVDLQMVNVAGNQGLGRFGWCQDSSLAYPAQRVNRGHTGPSYVTRDDSSRLHTDYGWRPALVQA